VKVPPNTLNRHPLGFLLGAAALRNLVKAYAGQRLEVPDGWATVCGARDRLIAGDDACEVTGLRPEQVEKIRRRSLPRDLSERYSETVLVSCGGSE